MGLEQLDDLFKTSDSDEEFPTLNPSKGPMKPQQGVRIEDMQQEESAPEQDTFQESMPTPMQEPVAKPESTSFLGRMKDKAIGVAKMVGGNVLGNAKLAAEQGPRQLATAITPLGRFAPSLENIPAVRGAFDYAENALKPSNETQKSSKEGAEVASLFIPFFAGTAGAITKMPQIAQRIEEVSLRLTPTQKRDLGDKVQRVSRLLLDRGITGSPTKRLNEVEAIYHETEEKLQTFLKTNNTAKAIWVPKTVYINRLEAIKHEFRNDREYETIVAQIDGAISNAKKIFRNQKIPIDRFNEYKRSVFDRAYNKNGTKVLDDVEFKVGDAAKDLLEESTRGLKIDGKEIGEFNQEYGTIINARKILQTAEDRPQVGLVGKLVSSLAGFSLGGAFGGAGAVVGGIAGPQIAPLLAGTAARSYVAQTANAIGKLAPAARKSLGTLLLGGGLVTTEHLQRILHPDETTEEPQEDPIEPKINTSQLDTFME